MAYRKPYYRKDGTYVSAYFDKRNNRKTSNNNKGCSVLLLFVIIVFTYFNF